MTDLIKRLRSQESVDTRPYEIERLTDEAADALEAANERIAALTVKCGLLAASLDKADLETAALELDRDRLDFMIGQRVWVQSTLRDGSILQYQVYDQDEDENYIIRSGEDRYFNAPREAIDAAMSATKEQG